MAPLTLPPTFQNSFWTQDYRTGLVVLFSQLEQGVAENDEIVAFLKARIRAEATFGSVLTHLETEGGAGTGFNTDEGASLHMTFKGLQQESASQGEAHREVARDLQEQVASPFEGWAYQHAQRIQATKEDLLDAWVGGYEAEIAEVERVRVNYLDKCRRADDVEDDMKFAPIQDSQGADKSTELLSPDGATTKRTPSVAERISSRLRGVAGGLPQAAHPPMASPKSTLQMINDTASDGGSDGTATPKFDKGKGKEVETHSPQPMSPTHQAKDLGITIPRAPSLSVTTHIVLGGVSFLASEVSALLFKAQSEMAVRTVKVTLLGEYDHCFSGEEFAVWLKTNVGGFNGSLDVAEDAARTLTEEYNSLRRIGELGNKFDNSPSVFYQFRPRAFNLQAALQRSQDDSVPVSPAGSQISENLASGLKRSNTVLSSIVKAVQTATNANPSEELPHMKARKEAEQADWAYRKAARSLDEHRCALEERIEDGLKTLQRWEMDRLAAVKTVLLQFQGITAAIGIPLSGSFDRSSLLISSFMPESDVKVLIERYRTGPFRPCPRIYESIDHHTDASFGIDLRKWAGEGAFQPIKSIGSIDEFHTELARDIPPVLVGLLEALRLAYGKLPDDDQRRKNWIYEVPLSRVHQLRAMLNTLPIDMPVSQDIFAKSDTPTLASTVKLWLLELNPPVGMWDTWDEVKKLYPSVGADAEVDSERSKELLEELKNVLFRLPTIHLKVLDAVITHLKTLIDTTTTPESNDVYVTKLSLSIGRSILRPKEETSMSLQSHHPQLFFADLVRHYEDVIPPTLERKKRESAQRAVPVRKRTKLVDARQMRRSVDASADPRKYLEAQFALKNPTSRPSSPNPSAVTGRPPAFISPPQSPSKSSSGGGPPSIETPEPPTHGSAPDVAIKAPSPVNLNEQTLPPVAKTRPSPSPPAVSQNAPQSLEMDEPFTPPTMSTAASTTPASPSSAAGSAGGDTILATGPPSLSRNTSADANRLRGPRVPLSRGPRPLSTAAAATVPLANNRPRQSSIGTSRGGASGRTGSPGPEARGPVRPRTPPDVKEYLPTKRGGRAAAGSFAGRGQPPQ